MFKWLREKLGLEVIIQHLINLHALTNAAGVDNATNLKLLNELHSRMDRLETKLGIQTGVSLGRDPLSADVQAESDRIARDAILKMSYGIVDCARLVSKDPHMSSVNLKPGA